MQQQARLAWISGGCLGGRSLSEASDEHCRRQIDAAKSLIGNWHDAKGEDAALRRPLMHGVEQFFDEIATRETRVECRTVLIGEADAPRFSASTPRVRVTPCRDGLAVSVAVPDWAKGLDEVISHDYPADVMRWVGHFARQYIYRSEAAKALMIAWDRERASLHMFGSRSTSRFYGNGYQPARSIGNILDIAVEDVRTEWGQWDGPAPRSRSAWLKRNTMDPGVHQGIFHFLRAQELLAAGFETEALVAFDCVIHALQAMPWRERGSKASASRADLFTAMGMAEPSIAVARQINFVRNNFGAHAGGWRWWDAGDEYDNDFLDRAASVVGRMLRRASDLEPEIRVIDPAPPVWANWLLGNFPRLWSIFWFR